MLVKDFWRACERPPYTFAGLTNFCHSKKLVGGFALRYVQHPSPPVSWEMGMVRVMTTALGGRVEMNTSVVTIAVVEKCPSVPVGTGFNPSIWSLEQLWVSGMARAPTPTCPAVLKQLL